MNEVMKGDLLFVYGSLRKGERADLSRNQSTDYLGEDRINGKLYAVSWYPGVKTMPSRRFDTTGTTVLGDVFRIRDPKVMVMLDAYEGYPSLFTRLQTKTERGQKVWVYVYGHEVGDHQLLDDGDWRKRITATATEGPSAV